MLLYSLPKRKTNLWFAQSSDHTSIYQRRNILTCQECKYLLMARLPSMSYDHETLNIIPIIYF